MIKFTYVGLNEKNINLITSSLLNLVKKYKIFIFSEHENIKIIR